MYFRCLILNFLDLPSVDSEMKILNGGGAYDLRRSEAESLRNVSDEICGAFMKW